jgi:hypothetical protein
VSRKYRLDVLTRYGPLIAELELPSKFLNILGVPSHQVATSSDIVNVQRTNAD